MMTREWKPEDNNRVQAVYESMQMPYPMPDVDSPLFSLKRVLVDDSGQVIGGGAVKPIGECFLWVKPNLHPVLRARAVKRLAEEARQRAVAAGFDELSAWIPPLVEPQFALPLMKLGFRMSPWRCWSAIL